MSANMQLLFFSLCFIRLAPWLADFGFGQHTVVMQESVVVSRSLSGHVKIGFEDITGKMVIVEVWDRDWKHVVASTRTDENGYFALPKIRGKIFNLRFTLPGVNPLQLRVRVQKSASRDLDVHLEVAT
jgi:hypothetical protein